MVLRIYSETCNVGVSTVLTTYEVRLPINPAINKRLGTLPCLDWPFLSVVILLVNTVGKGVQIIWFFMVIQVVMGICATVYSDNQMPQVWSYQHFSKIEGGGVILIAHPPSLPISPSDLIVPYSLTNVFRPLCQPCPRRTEPVTVGHNVKCPIIHYLLAWHIKQAKYRLYFSLDLECNKKRVGSCSGNRRVNAEALDPVGTATPSHH